MLVSSSQCDEPSTLPQLHSCSVVFDHTKEVEGTGAAEGTGAVVVVVAVRLAVNSNIVLL